MPKMTESEINEYLAKGFYLEGDVLVLAEDNGAITTICIGENDTDEMDKLMGKTIQ